MAYYPARDGQQLHVRVLGKGKPVLMLHGLGMQSRDWLPIVLPFLRRYQFYLPDFRGAGRSSSVRFNQDNVFTNLREDIEDLVAHFGLRDITLVGYSLGATTSLHWQNYGDFSPVSRYLHIDQTPCLRNRDDWHGGLFGAEQGAFFAQLESMLHVLSEAPPQGRVSSLPSHLQTAVVEHLLMVLSSMLSRPGVLNAYRATSRWANLWTRVLPLSDVADVRAYLRAYLTDSEDFRRNAPFPVPATVISGARSPLYPLAGQTAFAQQMQARHVVLPKAGHVPFLSQPVAFMRAFAGFLAQE